MEQSSPKVTVVVVPFPAQGHLNQLLHFALLLSSRGLTVHFAASTTHNHQARSRLHGWPSSSLAALTFHDLPLPPLSSSLSPDRNSAVNFPTHLLPLFEAAMQLQPQLRPILRSLSAASRRLIVVHDFLVPFAAAEAAALPNAESYRFHCVPAFFSISFLYEFQGKLPELAGKGVPRSLLAPLDGCIPEDFLTFVFQNPHMAADDIGSGGLVNSCRAVEGQFIELLSQEPRFCRKKLFAVGPIHPTIPFEKSGPRTAHECLQWLDEQPPASVVYISFGSITSLSDEQIEQLSIGLEHSEQRFIWVLRDADKGDVFSDDKGMRGPELPPGLEQRMESVGLVVKGWAPQLEILAHPATAAFVSHCGWNSCMEAISAGVPILAWPMHSDQPRNALMVVEELKVGVMVREWARRSEVVAAATIERMVRRIVAGEEVREVRRRAKELGEEIRRAVAEGGSSEKDLSSFIAQIIR